MQHYSLAKVMLSYSAKKKVGLSAALCFVVAFIVIVVTNVFDSLFNLAMYL